MGKDTGIIMSEIAAGYMMLWADDDKERTLVEKIVRAVEYYKEKYGHSPTHCFVSNDVTPVFAQVDGHAVKVERLNGVLKHHFMVGVSE